MSKLLYFLIKEFKLAPKKSGLEERDEQNSAYREGAEGWKSDKARTRLKQGITKQTQKKIWAKEETVSKITQSDGEISSFGSSAICSKGWRNKRQPRLLYWAMEFRLAAMLPLRTQRRSWPVLNKAGIVTLTLWAENVDPLEVQTVAVNGKAVIAKNGLVFRTTSVFLAFVPVLWLQGHCPVLDWRKGQQNFGRRSPWPSAVISIFVHGKTSLTDGMAGRELGGS